MLVADEEMPVCVAIPVRQVGITWIIPVQQVQPDRRQRQHPGLDADGCPVRVVGDAAVKAVHRNHGRPQEHHRVVPQSERLAVALHGEVSRDFPPLVCRMARMLAGVDGPLVFAEARRHLEGVSHGFDGAQQLVGRVEHSAVIDALAAVKLLQFRAQLVFVEEQ